MIVTVTMNPAVDKTVEVDEIGLGELNRLRNVITDAGGKGINVSKMVKSLGGSSVATGFLGGSNGDEIRRKLDEMGIKHDFVQVNSPTRMNMKVLENNGRVTELNEPGVKVSDAEISTLMKRLDDYADEKTLFVFSGSLPSGVEPDMYKRCIELVKKRGSKVFLDADGENFRLGLTAKPDFIKPNREELQKFFDVSAATAEELVPFCKKIIADGVGFVALSLGVDGALFMNGEKNYCAPGLKVKSHSTVGAGDSMVGALCFAADTGINYEEGLALSVAASAGAVMTVGTRAPEREVVEKLKEEVKLNEI